MPRGGPETILPLNDEEHIAELGKRTLSRAGYTVLTAKNGREAWELYRAQRGKISHVILDLIMPEMGGKLCLEALLKLDSSAKVIVTTGYGAGVQAPDILSSGAKGFIFKPCDIRQMLEVVRTVLDDK
jgi:two-component system, cell cycle sensor histidine kinase and response regulator CckA